MSLDKEHQLKANVAEVPLHPKGRISKPTKNFNGRQIVDISTYTPYFLSTVNNALSRGASQQYLKLFGVGIVEWRVISMLASDPGIPASHMCAAIYLDKSGTSRALKNLLQLKHVEFEAFTADPRRKLWWLSPSGYDLHDQILEMALEREKKLLQGIEPEDIEAFLRVIRQMRHNVDKF